MKLKFQYFGHLMQRAIGKDPDAGKIEDKRRRGQQRMRWIDSISNSTDMNLKKLREIAENSGTWCPTVQEVTKRHNFVIEQQQQNYR